MRFRVPAALISVLLLTCVYAPALSIDDSAIALAELQIKADRAQRKDRCFLYAQLVSRMSDLAGKQLTSGDSGQALDNLKLAQRYAAKIHEDVTDDSKKLRDAELLMQHTSFRLKSMVNRASYEDRPAIELTLKQLNQIQRELMMRVFEK